MKPHALKKGDTIAFVSPSLRFNESHATALARSKRYFEEQGYKVKTIYSTLSSNHRASVLERCRELESAFADPEVSAVLCTIGGSHANELLPHLNYDLIRANPKIFAGFSDITLLHTAILSQTGLRTFYSPAALTEFGEAPAPLVFTAEHFFRVLTDPTPPGPFPRSKEWASDMPAFLQSPESAEPRTLAENPGWKWLRTGKAQGRLFGGCLSSLMHLPGTKYWPDLAGKVLFWEHSMEANMQAIPVAKTRAWMADLVNIGTLGLIAGMVVGRPFAHDEAMLREFEKAILDQCEGTDFPILTGVDVGHTSPMLTLPLDALVQLDSGKDEFSVLESVVE